MAFRDALQRISQASADARAAQTRGELDVSALILQEIKRRLASEHVSDNELLQMAKMAAKLEGQKFRLL